MTLKELRYNPLHLGWVVGIIEGEGCIYVRGKRLNVTVAMTDVDTVERLHEWTGVGHVTRLNYETVSGKPIYQWRITKRDDAGRFLQLILPLLGKRRGEVARLAILVWKSYRTRGTSPTCGKGHHLSPSNLRIAIDANGSRHRRCRKCETERMRRWRGQKKEVAA